MGWGEVRACPKGKERSVQDHVEGTMTTLVGSLRDPQTS